MTTSNAEARMFRFAPLAATLLLLGAGSALAAEGMACCKEKCCCDERKGDKPAPQPAPQQPSGPTAPSHQH